MSRYIVRFIIDGSTHLIKPPENCSIQYIKEGFWVDDDYKWCTNSNNRWFIMPHMVTSVFRIKEPS